MYYGYVYKITCLVNGKIYIGQHKGSSFDKRYFGSGKALRNSIKKHGRKNFLCEVIEFCSTKEELNEREIFWISELNSTDTNIGYNITHGGEGVLGVPCSEEKKKHLRITSTRSNLNMPKEHYARVSESAKGNKMMNKDGVCVRVHPSEFEVYLNDGWVFGGLPRKVDRSGSKNPAYGKSYVQGRVWVHKGTDRLYIMREELPKYESLGWIRGMKDTDYPRRENYLSR